MTVSAKSQTLFDIRAQELCESRGGRPGLPSLIHSPYGLCGRKATLKKKLFNSSSSHCENEQRVIVQELCESRGGRPGLSVLTSLLISGDVKLY